MHRLIEKNPDKKVGMSISLRDREEREGEDMYMYIYKQWDKEITNLCHLLNVSFYLDNLCVKVHGNVPVQLQVIVDLLHPEDHH